jgi:hypothetical protein
MLMGNDDFCMSYITAFKAGEALVGISTRG